MVFGIKKNHKAPKLNIAIDGKILEMANQTNVLGLLMNESLSLKAHINHAASKVAKCIGILKRERHILMIKTLTMLYCAFTHPYFSYCDHLWGNTYITNLDMLFKLYNKLVSIIYNSEYDVNNEILYKNVKIMKFITMNKLQIGIHKYHHALILNCVLMKCFDPTIPTTATMMKWL